jgi:hypothetical protein
MREPASVRRAILTRFNQRHRGRHVPRLAHFPIACAAQAADGLHPAERLLDLFADPLPNRIGRYGAPCGYQGLSRPARAWFWAKCVVTLDALQDSTNSRAS